MGEITAPILAALLRHRLGDLTPVARCRAAPAVARSPRHAGRAGRKGHSAGGPIPPRRRRTLTPARAITGPRTDPESAVPTRTRPRNRAAGACDRHRRSRRAPRADRTLPGTAAQPDDTRDHAGVQHLRTRAPAGGGTRHGDRSCAAAGPGGACSHGRGRAGCGSRPSAPARHLRMPQATAVRWRNWSACATRHRTSRPPAVER